jgi:hypothetical protein
MELNSNPNLICVLYMDNEKQVDNGTVFSIAAAAIHQGRML